MGSVGFPQSVQVPGPVPTRGSHGAVGSAMADATDLGEEMVRQRSTSSKGTRRS